MNRHRRPGSRTRRVLGGVGMVHNNNKMLHAGWRGNAIFKVSVGSGYKTQAKAKLKAKALGAETSSA